MNFKSPEDIGYVPLFAAAPDRTEEFLGRLIEQAESLVRKGINPVVGFGSDDGGPGVDRDKLSKLAQGAGWKIVAQGRMSSLMPASMQ